MTNLIPPSAKKQVQTEYWVRVCSVWMMLIGAAFLFVSILFVPAYVLVQSQLEAFALEFDAANTLSESFEESKATLVQANTIAKALATEDTSIRFTSLLDILEVLAGQQVTVNTFTLSKKDGVISAITISGQATTRHALVAFSDAIEANALFASADIPLSMLAKDKDLPFTLTIVPSSKP